MELSRRRAAPWGGANAVNGVFVRPEVDPRQAAMSFAGACFLSAYQRHMFGAAARRKLPPLDGAVSTLVKLIER
jgi:hypothetical protein